MNGHYKVLIPEKMTEVAGEIFIEYALIKTKKIKLLGQYKYTVRESTMLGTDLSGLSQPYWVNRSRNEAIKKGPTITVEVPDMYVSKSYTVPGYEGIRKYTWTEEYIDGEPTGKKTAEVSVVTKQPLPDKYYKGLKADPVVTWVKRSTQESIPIATKVVYDPAITKEASYVEPGIEGLREITWEAEILDGNETGNIRNQQIKVLLPMVHEVNHIGIKIENVTYNYVKGDRCDLTKTLSGFGTAGDAQRDINAVRTVDPGRYYVWTTYENAVNIAVTNDLPGVWILNGPYLKKV